MGVYQDEEYEAYAKHFGPAPVKAEGSKIQFDSGRKLTDEEMANEKDREALYKDLMRPIYRYEEGGLTREQIASELEIIAEMLRST